MRKKAFLFVSKKEVRLKLERSAPDAKRRGHPVGAGGWTMLDPDDLPATPLLKQWIAESYALCAGAGGASAPAKKSKAVRRPKR